jgi:acyl-[acyl carrier protein]--UDP-N-acetylglucosamine O-acyltransferase
MVGPHVAHDRQLGNDVIVANNVMMGGHVSIADHVVVDGAAAIHQFVRVGRGAMAGGVSGVAADVIPFGFVFGNRLHLTGLKVIGLRRLGFDKRQVGRLHIAFGLLFRDEGLFKESGAGAGAVRHRSAGRPRCWNLSMRGAITGCSGRSETCRIAGLRRRCPMHKAPPRDPKVAVWAPMSEES